MRKNPIRQLAEQTILYGLGTIVPRFLNYAVLTPFYTRVFRLDQYGMVSELYAYMAILLVILTYGMETGYFRFASTAKNPDRVFFSTATMVGTTSLLFLIILVIWIKPVAAFLQYSGHKNYIIYFGAIVALDAFTAIPFARLRLQNKGLKFGLIKLANVGVIIISVFVFLYLLPALKESGKLNGARFPFNGEVDVVYVFIANLLGSLLSLILLAGEFKGYRPQIDKKLVGNMLGYSMPLLLAGLFGIFNESFDKVILKRIIPEGQDGLALLGEYSANYKVAVLMTLFIQMFRYALEPFFFNEAKKEKPQLLYARVMQYFVIFAIVVYLGIIINLDIIVKLIGKTFRGGIGVVPIILAANMLYGVFINLSVWYKINDKTHYATMINGAGALITIIINVTLIPVYGYYASAWGHVAAYVVMVLLSYIIGKRIYPVPYDLRKIGVYIAGGVVFLSLIYIVGTNHNVIRIIAFNVLLLLTIMGVYKFEKKQIWK